MGAVMLDLVEVFDRLDEYTADAKAIAWDTCHKIYVLMDDEQVALMRSYGYGDEPDPDSLITSDELSSKEMSEKVMEWYQRSCALRFINAVHTTPNPNDGFITIIGQFEDQPEEDEEEDDDEWWAAEE
jgi:hypothetical protein